MSNSDGGQNEWSRPVDPRAEFRRPPPQHYGPAASHPPLSAGSARFGAAPGTPQTNGGSGFYQPQAAPGGSGTAPGAGLALKPWHFLWIAAAAFLLVALFVSSSLSWVLLAVACGLGGVYLRERYAASTVPSGPAQTAPPMPLIPLRAMAIPEIFSGTAKIMLRYWPALLGIPVVILVGFALFVYASAATLGTVVVKATMSVGAGGLANLDNLMTGMLVVWLVYFVVVAAIALPTDALLISLTVIATDRAVRGLPIQSRDVLRLARQRMFAVCRLTLVFYAILLLPQLVFYLVLTSSPKMMIALAGPGGLVLTFLVMFPIYFGLGLILSLAPIAVVAEGRGVGAALQRSVQLLKPAFGRILGIHVLWSVCMAVVLWGYFTLLGDQILTDLVDSPLLAGADLLLFAGVLGVMIGFFRVLQALIYTDVRIRQEGYDRELIADWNRAVAGGVATQPAMTTGKALLAAAVGVAVIAGLSIVVSAFSGPSDDDVINALKADKPAGLFKNGKAVFHVDDLEEAGQGWYVAIIKFDGIELEPGTVVLRRSPVAGDRLTVVDGPGTDLHFQCPSFPQSVQKLVHSCSYGH
ncbi:hypothetical protein OS122_12025 [Mycolicibacterium mucogenicum]|uniref:hypothetical protein n=1 Tax=Mycolicibacterium mucogenicum TaxID=56689 RepID=UPI00226A3A78|nr:hypothetical protein [Mycolicibacterium mucogenicum]MCX8561609.1 hypothetical protein [Mycolicibacterium mucogenicum]